MFKGSLYSESQGDTSAPGTERAWEWTTILREGFLVGKVIFFLPSFLFVVVFFFLIWAIVKVFTEHVTILLLLFVLFCFLTPRHVRS